MHSNPSVTEKVVLGHQWSSKRYPQWYEAEWTTLMRQNACGIYIKKRRGSGCVELPGRETWYTSLRDYQFTCSSGVVKGMYTMPLYQQRFGSSALPGRQKLNSGFHSPVTSLFSVCSSSQSMISSISPSLSLYLSFSLPLSFVHSFFLSLPFVSDTFYLVLVYNCLTLLSSHTLSLLLLFLSPDISFITPLSLYHYFSPALHSFSHPISLIFSLSLHTSLWLYL